MFLSVWLIEVCSSSTVQRRAKHLRSNNKTANWSLLPVGCLCSFKSWFSLPPSLCECVSVFSRMKALIYSSLYTSFSCFLLLKAASLSAHVVWSLLAFSHRAALEFNLTSLKPTRSRTRAAVKRRCLSPASMLNLKEFGSDLPSAPCKTAPETIEMKGSSDEVGGIRRWRDR